MMPDWSWHTSAACRGEDLYLFFGGEGERLPDRLAREQKAKTVCGPCPVRRACLDFALSANEKAGVWGALGEDERASERRRRQRRAAEGRPAPEPVLAAKVGEKLCLHCDRTLPVEAFGSDVKKKDGLHVWCKSCTNEAARRRRQEAKQVVA